MPPVAIPIDEPDPDEVLREVRAGNDRLDELTDALDSSRDSVSGPLLELVSSGDVAVFPIGETVKIRDESRSP